MDLICSERLVTDNRFAERDPVVFDDKRVLEHLLECEHRYVPSCNYFAQVQSDLKPFMRKVVVTWMLEVCEEQRCENQVFPLAVNFLDRFLCATPLKKEQLQLLAAVCLLLATKIRQCHALSVDLLCFYSDHSITPQQMRTWEMLVLSKLTWQMTAVTGSDFVDHVLERMTWSRGHTLVRRHAHTLLSVCCIVLDFMQVRPSILASASIVSAANGLRLSGENETALEAVCRLSNANPEDVLRVVAVVEDMIKKESGTFQLNIVQPTATVAAPPPALKVVDLPPTDPPSPDAHPVTPTDIQEINF